MIPAIALMMGAYIITRMMSMLGRAGDQTEPRHVRVAAFITILVTIFSLITILEKADMFGGSRNLQDLFGPVTGGPAREH